MLIKNPIWSPVINLATQKLNSNSWIDQYIGMTALGSILCGPDSTLIFNQMETVYTSVFTMFNTSEVARVRYATGWVIHLIAKYVPSLVFKSQENLELLINTGCTHLEQDH